MVSMKKCCKTAFLMYHFKSCKKQLQGSDLSTYTCQSLRQDTLQLDKAPQFSMGSSPLSCTTSHGTLLPAKRDKTNKDMSCTLCSSEACTEEVLVFQSPGKSVRMQENRLCVSVSLHTHRHRNLFSSLLSTYQST